MKLFIATTITATFASTANGNLRSQNHSNPARTLQGTPDAETPATEGVCDSYKEQKAAYGLCVAFCEAKDCDTEGHPSCDRIKANFLDVTGAALPCEQVLVDCTYKCCNAGTGVDSHVNFCMNVQINDCDTCESPSDCHTQGSVECGLLSYLPYKGAGSFLKGDTECGGEAISDLEGGYKGDSCCDSFTNCYAARRVLFRNQVLEDASFDPTPEEAFKAAEETGGNLEAGFISIDKMLSSEECKLLVDYINQADGIDFWANKNDKLIMIRDKSPLEDIIGLEKTRELFQFFKTHSNDAAVTQIWLRRMTGEDGLYMGLHTDDQPYEMKIALNDSYGGGEVLVVDKEGARRLSVEVGSGYFHDSGLVHGHMPHTGDKYILYLINDPVADAPDLSKPALGLNFN